MFLNMYETNYLGKYGQQNLYGNMVHLSDNEFMQSSLFYTDNSLVIFLVALCLIINMAFKMTAAPFHSWAPMVYGGAPLPTTTYLSMFSKLTIITFAMMLFYKVFLYINFYWSVIFGLLGVFSMMVSIWGALTEKLIKRFFVYSSVGHVGYMICGMATSHMVGISAVMDYLLIYVVSSLIIWIILMFLTKKTTHLMNLKGLGEEFPMISLILVMTMFSLSGLPPMAGFFVKFEIFYSLLNSNLYFLTYMLLMLTVMSFFYYLRIVKMIYFEKRKKYSKKKVLEYLQLRLISLLVFIIPLYMVFMSYPLLYIMKQIIESSS